MLRDPSFSPSLSGSLENLKQESEKHFEKSLIQGDTTQTRGRPVAERFSRKKGGPLAAPSAQNAPPWTVTGLPLHSLQVAAQLSSQ